MKKMRATTQNELRREFIDSEVVISNAIKRVLLSGRYILGPELERFEKNFAAYVGTKYCVGVGNGFDALYIALRMIRPYYSAYIHKQLHISTTNAAILSKHEILSDPLNADIIIPVVSPKTGCDYPLAQFVVEDACQSIGMKRKVPANVYASCYSFHPLKVLHCYGDGGAICMNDKVLYKRVKEFRNHGRIGKTKQYGIGVNSRLDEIQAAVLNAVTYDLSEQRAAGAYSRNARQL
jgi:dTDP-4-amino-4,6-dideoxygalactose transaminase